VTSDSLYIYLARLDKKGVEMIAAFPHKSRVFPSKVADISSLGLERRLYGRVQSEFAKRKMTHELYVESASSFDNLLTSLSKRGYTNLPTHQFTGNVLPSKINQDSLVTAESTMLRRSSSVRR
jgi:hypothetical protein